MFRLLSTLAGMLVLATGRAFANGDHDHHRHADCPPGEICGQAVVLGAWGLIALGLLSCLVALVPSRPKAEGEAGKGLPLLGILQARIEKETTGWRRLQWPLLGLFFIALGVATLAGWR